MTARSHQRLGMILGLFSLLAGGVALAAPGDVLSTVPSPAAYPSGLAYDGSHLIVADWREAKLFSVDPGTGEVVRTWPAPTLKPHGLTFGDGNIWVSDDHTGTVQALNPKTGVVERTFEAPEKQAFGLAFANETLYILAMGKIYRVLPEDGTILSYFDAPEPTCRCIAFDGHYLWVSDRITNEIYMVDPVREKVVNILPAPGPYAAGLAWADKTLWNVDFQKRAIYQLEIQGNQKYRLSEPRRARIEHTWSLSNYGPGSVMDLHVNVAVPMELPSQKLLTEVVYSREPVSIVRDRWGQGCALFDIGSVPAGTNATVDYHVDAEVSAIRFLIMPDEVGRLEDIPEAIRQAYLADGSRFRIKSPYIQEQVHEIVGDEQNPYWIARKIYDHIIAKLEYQMVGGWDVPEVVLKRGTGSCSEYTYTFIALCRAAGVPARYQGSVVVRGDDASVDEAFHRWAQIYLPNYGWVPVDANRGDKPLPADQARGFGGLANRFLITTQDGGDSKYLHWGYNAYADYKTDGYCHVEQDTFGLWEPLGEGLTEPVLSNEKPGGCGTP